MQGKVGSTSVQAPRPGTDSAGPWPGVGGRAGSLATKRPRPGGAESASLDQDEVVPVHGLLGGVWEELLHLLGAHALDAVELFRRVVDEALADHIAVAGDLDGVPGLESPLDRGDAHGQQAAAALAENARRALVDDHP